MPRSQMQSHLIQVALLYSILKECRTLAEASRSSRSLMAEIQVRLEETFTISQEQKVSYASYFGLQLTVLHTDEYTPHCWRNDARTHPRDVYEDSLRRGGKQIHYLS